MKIFSSPAKRACQARKNAPHGFNLPLLMAIVALMIVWVIISIVAIKLVTML